MRLYELFDDAVDYRWVKNTVAVFSTDSSDFEVMFNKKFGYDNVWGVAFRDMKSGYGISGGGDAIVIFSTVLAIIREFIRLQKPAGIIFSANNSELSRQKLYARMLKKLAGGHKVNIVPSGNIILYSINFME